MDFEEKFDESDEIIVLDSDSEDEVENEEVFEMKVPAKKTPEIITLDSDSDNDDTESKLVTKIKK